MNYFLALACSLGLAQATSAQAIFIPLGDVPGSVGISRLHHFSADGSVGYGESHFPGNVFRTNQWTVGQGVELVGTSLGTTHEVRIRDLSASGTRVIGSVLSGAVSSEGFLWDASTGTQLLGDLIGGTASTPTGISDDGTVIVGWSASAQLDSEAFVWIEGQGMIGLGAGGPDSPYFNWTRAYAVSADGSLVMGESASANGVETFLWTQAGGMQVIDNGQTLWPLVSSDGTIIAGTQAGPIGQGNQPILWTAQGVTVLGNAPGHVNGQPRAMDALGTVVVGTGASQDNCTALEPWIWTPNSGTLILKDYLLSRGAAGLDDWCLVVCTSISADGNVLTGTGFDPEGNSRGWVAYLDAPPAVNVGTPICSPAVSNSTGVPATLLAIGSKLVENNATSLQVNGLPTNQTGFFLNGSTSTFQPMAGGSQGNLCLGGTVGRYVRAGEVQNSGTHGAIALEIDLMDTPGPAGDYAVLSGQSLVFQAWYRDVNPLATSNFSDAAQVNFQ